MLVLVYAQHLGEDEEEGEEDEEYDYTPLTHAMPRIQTVARWFKNLVNEVNVRTNEFLSLFQ